MYKYQIVPVVTEKSTIESTEGKYHFYVPINAPKIELKKQLSKMYGKKVEKINTQIVKRKHRRFGRGRMMTKRKPKKKIIVTFEKNSSIDINKIK